MNIEQEREAFERHWRDFYQLGTKLARINGRYHSHIVQRAWESWQARAALQSQHDEETKRLRDALKLARDRARGFMNDSGADTDSLPEIDAAIDHARRIEGDEE